MLESQRKYLQALADEAGVGEITLRDIVKELEKPAKETRVRICQSQLRKEVLR